MKKARRQPRKPDLAQEFEFAKRNLEDMAEYSPEDILKSVLGDRARGLHLHPRYVERLVFEFRDALRERAKDLKGRVYWMACGQKIARKIKREY